MFESFVNVSVTSWKSSEFSGCSLGLTDTQGNIPQEDLGEQNGDRKSVRNIHLECV